MYSGNFKEKETESAHKKLEVAYRPKHGHPFKKYESVQ